MVGLETMVKKILFISAHAPTNNYPQAGQKIAFNHLQAYQTSHQQVDIIVVANREEIAAATDIFNPANLFTYPLTKPNKIYRCLVDWRFPFKFTTRYHHQVLKYIQKLCIYNHYNTIHFEYSHAAVYLHWMRNYFAKYPTQSRPNIVISIHDIIVQSSLRQSAQFPLLGIETARIFQYEKSIYSQANQLWVLSTKDRDILTSLYSISPQKILIKPPPLSNFINQVKRHPSTIKPKTLMFWGAMNRLENEQAVLTFIHQCFQQILQQDGEYKLYIVGSQPSERLRSRANGNIIITGFVADPTPYFAMVEWGIVPLITGAGIKLKTLEMLAAGIPVISTSIGAEGIDTLNSNLIVNDNIPDWINLIIKT